MKTFLLFSLSFLIHSAFFAQNIVLDSTFGENGLVIFDNPAYSYYNSKVVETDNHDLIICSFVRNNSDHKFYQRIIKIDRNGRLYEDFGVDGEIIIYLEIFDDNYPSICMIGNNKFAVFEEFYTGKISVQIFDIDGNFVNDFNIVRPGWNVGYLPKGILFTGENLFIAAEFYKPIYIPDFQDRNDSILLCKTDINGIIDSTFSENGFLLSWILHRNCNITDFIQNKDYFIVSLKFYSEISSSFARYSQIIKFNKDGIFDNIFVENGILLKEGNHEYRLKADESDNVYLCDEKNKTVEKLDIEGRIVITYGENGIANDTNDILIELNEYNIAEKNGEIFHVGSKRQNGKYYSYLMKFDQSGSIQTLWGDNGLIEIDSLHFDFHINYFDSYGRLLVLGEQFTDQNIGNLAIMRFITDSSSSSNDISFSDQFSIFPNPVKENILNIDLKKEISENIKICLFDINHRQISTLFEGKIPQNTLTLKTPDNLKMEYIFSKSLR